MKLCEEQEKVTELVGGKERERRRRDEERYRGRKWKKSRGDMEGEEKWGNGEEEKGKEGEKRAREEKRENREGEMYTKRKREERKRRYGEEDEERNCENGRRREEEKIGGEVESRRSRPLSVTDNSSFHLWWEHSAARVTNE